MREIVKATGLSKGAFYHYFESKEQIFIEVITTFYFDKMVIHYDKLDHESLFKFYHDYISRIKIFMKEFKTFFNYNDPDVKMNYLTMMFDALNLFPGFKEKVKEAHEVELDAWTAVIKRARKNGEFESPMSDKQVARIFIYTNDGVALHLLLNGELSTAPDELLKLWDNFYIELKD